MACLAQQRLVRKGDPDLAPTERTDIKTAVDQIGDPWSLLIVWQALHGTTRFEGFKTGLGVSRNILSDRLSKLIEAGVLVKRPVCDGARRLEYRLTGKGKALRPALELLEAWGSDVPIDEGSDGSAHRRLPDHRHHRISDPPLPGKRRVPGKLKSASR
jgi:DNA-binding HxlR family transcriptional regulator